MADIYYRIRKKLFDLGFYPLSQKTKIWFRETGFIPTAILRAIIRGYKYRSLRKSDFPEQIHVEVTNKCNSLCVMCPHEKQSRKLQVIDDALYKKIVDECAKEPLKIFWAFMLGEPLLDKNLADKIKYAKNNGIKEVAIFSNGSLMTKERGEELIKSGLDHVTFSLDCFREETYKKIRKGLNFSAVTENIKGFMKLREDTGLKKPSVAIEITEMDENKDEIDQFVDYWQKIVDAVYISVHTNWTGAQQDRRKQQSFRYFTRRPCYRLWSDLIVHVDGKATFCCLDYDGQCYVGDVIKSSIKEIWNSKEMEEIRKTQIAGKYDELALCKNCDAWDSLAEPWWI